MKVVNLKVVGTLRVPYIRFVTAHGVCLLLSQNHATRFSFAQIPNRSFGANHGKRQIQVEQVRIGDKARELNDNRQLSPGKMRRIRSGTRDR